MTNTAVEPLRAVLADPHHLAAAARAVQALWLDHPFDPLKMVRQAADIAPGRLTRRAPAAARFAFCFSLCNRRFEIFKQEVELVSIKALRLLAIERAAQLLHQVLKPFVPGFNFPNLVGDGGSLFFGCSCLLLVRGNQPCLRGQNCPHLWRKLGKFSGRERLGHDAYYTVLRAL